MMPSKQDLLPYVDDRKSAAEKFDVSIKTISRWMKENGIYKPRKNYGTKLSLEKARDIREKYKDGQEIKDLAKEYYVTFSTISRIIQNITYQDLKETAIVSVTYNIS